MEKWYNLKIEEVLKKLDSNENGILNNEAKKRLEINGYNKLKEVKKKTILVRFIEQFKNVMIIVLIVAAILAGIVSIKEGEPLTDTIIILFVVMLNAILGVVQESKAEKAIEALKNMSLPYIKVKRDNQILNIKTEELVIGDIVLIEAGDSIPADMRIIQSHSLRIEEAALTGESVPVDKITDVILVDEVSLADRDNMMYSGSNVVYGRGIGIVTAIGMDTEIGKIAKAISNISEEETPLQKKMNEISKMLTILVGIISVVMVIVGFVQGKEILDVFMLAIALAVAAIPEGLAAVITITLAIGVQKMADKNAIIRKLSAVEALGCTEIICSDKTGTLTQNRMTVKKLFLNNNLTDNLEDLKGNDFFIKVLTLCNDVKKTIEDDKEKLLGDPTETALVDLVNKIDVDKEDYENRFKRLEEAPFDSERKMMTTVNKLEDKYLVCTKGAIESVLEKCTYILINNEVRKIAKEDIINIQNVNVSLAEDAYRVLGYAYKLEDNLIKIENKEDVNKVENNLIFIGLSAMIDPPRPEVKDAVSKCFKAGMIPVMITGDNVITAKTIAKDLGIIKEGELALTGLEVDKLNDEELLDIVEKVKVYARVSPDNKIRIVKAWKNKGKIVAMTGDGVNDAPALKGADIGVGMGITGTEVSKSVSSMVLSDDNFATIVSAVGEGRRIYDNIKNVIVYLLASNLAEVVIIFVSMLFSKTMLLPIQILWINLISDTIPAIALGFEKEEKGIMNKKPRNSKESFFTPFLMTRIMIPAVIKSFIVFVLYIVVSSNYTALIAGSAAFILLSIIEILFAFVCRSDKKSVLSIGLFSNKVMTACVFGTLILQTIVFILPVTSNWLGIGVLPINVWYMIIFFSVLSFVIFEIIKVGIAKSFKKI